MRRSWVLAAALLAAPLACSDCDDSDAEAMSADLRQAQAEFHTMFTRAPDIRPVVKKLPDGKEVVDVNVKFDAVPAGYTEEQLRTSANLIVRKHVRRVRDVNVSF